jgi:NAD(P)-dependent dehydrogenase (short-subunit alcohol dehydrogenase family)
VSTLEGKAAAISGSSRGIGRSVARTLAGEGAAVVVNGRDARVVEEVVSELEAEGARAAACVGSVADDAMARQLIECCRDSFGGIDILINCAGIAEPEGSTILTITPEEWREQIDSHLTATFYTCRHAAPHLVERRSGAIVNTSSSSWLGLYGGTGYPAGKGGVNSLTFSIAGQLRHLGVRANAVCPGARTRLSSGPAYEAKIQDLHARGILSDALRDASLAVAGPDHVGPAYAFLAGELSHPLTGRLLTASGGYVGLQTGVGGESLLAYRDAAEGPWPVELLAQQIQARLAAPGPVPGAG